MQAIKLPANYYQQFDADYTRDVPAEGYGGWKKADVEISYEHTAVVVMHAWETGAYEEYPGWHRAIEYIPRAARIAKTVFPPLLCAVRRSGMKLFHVVGGGDYYKKCPGYLFAKELAGEPEKSRELAEPDPILKQLKNFKRHNVHVGPHNEDDVKRGFAKVDFIKEAMPAGDEGVAENAGQLFGLCKHHSVNHLIYAGFAINWCILLSPGGMADMSKHGVMCSAFRQAVTAVENKESARNELCKEFGLWRVALAFGFVFDVDDFIRALQSDENFPGN